MVVNKLVAPHQLIAGYVPTLNTHNWYHMHTYTYNTSVHSAGVTQDQVKLIVNCSITPTTWCRAQFNGECSCIPHNDTSNSSIFPENTTFLTSSVFLLLEVSEFRKIFAGSFIVCASGRSIHKAYHIAGTYVHERIVILNLVCYRNT